MLNDIKIEEEKEDEEEEELDMSWSDEFIKNDKLYEKYYLEDVSFVKIHCIYLDHKYRIFNIKEQQFEMKEKNTIKQSELVSILKNNYINKSKKFSVLSILKYNLDISPLEIQKFIDGDVHSFKDYLTPILSVKEDIVFQKTITMLQDMNDLFILLLLKKAGAKHLFLN